jgi:hypothetical protein
VVRTARLAVWLGRTLTGEDLNRKKFDKIAGSDFERAKRDPERSEWAEGRMPGVILPSPPKEFEAGSSRMANMLKRSW